MPRNCNVHGNCIDCPEIAPTPSQSAQVVLENVLGWTAGANSVATLDGNVRVVFSVTPPTLGILVGFKIERTFVTSPSRQCFGFYLTLVSGLPFYHVREYGVQRTSNARWFGGDDVFEINRVNGVVTYLFNGARVYTSETAIGGPVLVNACLYGAGDNVQ